MSHKYCVRDGRRIPAGTKKVRLTSQPQIKEHLQYFGEELPVGEPICEHCRDELKRKYARSKQACDNAMNLRQLEHSPNQQNIAEMNNRASPTPQNEFPGSESQNGGFLEPETPNEPRPSTSRNACKSAKIYRDRMDSEDYIAAEAQYSESSNDAQLFFESQEFDFGSKSKPQEKKYFVEHIVSVAATERKCFLCPEKSRNKIPLGAIDQLFIKHRIYVPLNNRCCQSHLSEGTFSEESMSKIREISRQGATLSPKEFSDLLNRIADEADRNRIDFDSNLISENEYKLLLGITKVNFKHLYEEYIVKTKGLKNSKNRSTRNALAIFLAKLRLGVSHEFLGFLFGMDKRRISDSISSITGALEENFVPKYLGYHHISREDVKSHTPELVTGLYRVSDESLVLILDGTYIYIQKSQDHQSQAETYSLHKKRNLVKAMMVVLPDGYILEAESIYKSNAKNNDASMLQDMFRAEDGIKSFVKEGDHFVLDRGFRDVIQYLMNQGIVSHMPHFLDIKTKQKQFTPDQANESRTVTMTRWVVEAVNGRIKHKFQIFDKEVHNTYLQYGDPEKKTCKLKSFFRIACALINAFSPPLSVNKPWHRMVLDKVEERMNLNNVLRENIEKKEIDLSLLKWTKTDANSLMDFPILSEEDLFEITLGCYQIKNAKWYAKRYLEEDPSFRIHFYKEDDNILRARIHSRFHQGDHHIVWLQVDSSAEGSAQIPFYYCKCKVGARDVGCCSHTTVVIWFLGFWRHMGEPINRMSFSSVLLDAARKKIPIEAEPSE